MSLEEQYYENDAFWGDRHATDADKARIERVLGSLPQDTGSLLDVGCGDGICCNQASQRLPGLKRIVGFDRSPTALKHVSVEKRVGDISALPFADGEFDAAVSLEVLEHLPLATFEAALNELARVTRDRIIVTVPCRENLRHNFARCPCCESEFSRCLHMRSFDNSKMQTLFASHGFRCLSVEVLTASTPAGLQALLRWSRRLQGRGREMSYALCPVCGYHDEQARKTPHRAIKDWPAWKQFAKRAWPRVAKPHWLLGCYQKTTPPATKARGVESAAA